MTIYDKLTELEELTMAKYQNHIKTAKSLTIMLDEGDPINILSTDKLYNIISKALNAHEYQKVIDIISDSKNIIKYVTLGKFSLNNEGTVVINDKPIPKPISDKLVKFVNLNIDTLPLEKFWDNLGQNPSEESQKDLFTFLEKNHIPITEDGNFIAYRSVRNDFKDHHTGTMDNRVGNIVEMERASVNSDRSVACASGLHVAAYRYLPTMPAGIILEVKVDPKDVVSVPIDHDTQKMRVCRFEILSVHSGGELQDELYGHKPEKTVKETPVMTVTKKEPQVITEVKPKTVFILKSDATGRIRLPNELLRLAKIDNFAVAVIKNVRSRNIIVSSKYFANMYLIKSYRVTEGCVKLPPSLFEEAKIIWEGTYTAKIVNDTIEIRQTKPN